MKIKRLLSLILACIFLLAGCNSASMPDGTDEDQSATDKATDSPTEVPTDAPTDKPTEAPTEPITYTYFIDEEKKPLYRVIYPADAREVIKHAAELLCSHLCEITGVEFEISDDSAEVLGEAGEILVGNTNRADSNLELVDNNYALKRVGNNVVVTGKNDFSTAVAVKEFINLVDKNTPGIDEKLSVVAAPSEVYRVALTNSKDATIDIYNLIPFSDEPILERRIQTTAGCTGINFRIHETHGEVIIVASGTRAELLDYDTGKLLWYTNYAAPSSHGAELLPNGVAAIASSHGNAIRFFDVDGSRTKYIEVEFKDAHAVLWDPKNELLWGLGETELRAFKVVKAGKNDITVTEDMERYTKLPSNLGHDLAPYYYDDDKMWVTVFSTFYIYDKTTKTFTKEVEGDDGLIVRRRVKGIGNFADGSMVTAYPDELETSYQTWTTEKINFYFKLGDKLYYCPFATPDMHHYKCRIICTDYQ